MAMQYSEIPHRTLQSFRRNTSIHLCYIQLLSLCAIDLTKRKFGFIRSQAKQWQYIGVQLNGCHDTIKFISSLVLPQSDDWSQCKHFALTSTTVDPTLALTGKTHVIVKTQSPGSTAPRKSLCATSPPPVSHPHSFSLSPEAIFLRCRRHKPRKFCGDSDVSFDCPLCVSMYLASSETLAVNLAR